jgi:hypothetical protein
MHSPAQRVRGRVFRLWPRGAQRPAPSLDHTDLPKWAMRAGRAWAHCLLRQVRVQRPRSTIVIENHDVTESSAHRDIHPRHTLSRRTAVPDPPHQRSLRATLAMARASRGEWPLAAPLDQPDSEPPVDHYAYISGCYAFLCAANPAASCRLRGVADPHEVALFTASRGDTGRSALDRGDPGEERRRPALTECRGAGDPGVTC